MTINSFLPLLMWALSLGDKGCYINVPLCTLLTIILCTLISYVSVPKKKEKRKRKKDRKKKRKRETTKLLWRALRALVIYQDRGKYFEDSLILWYVKKILVSLPPATCELPSRGFFTRFIVPSMFSIVKWVIIPINAKNVIAYLKLLDSGVLQTP